MSQLRTCACLLGALLLTGCTAVGAAEHATGHTAAGAAEHTAAGAAEHTAAGPTRATGQVTGRLLIEGGPVGPYGQQPGERPIPGTVTFTTARHRPVSVGVGASGRFSVWLPPGRYQAAGRSPDIITVTDSGRDLEQTCSGPVSVIVTGQHTATIAVVCIVP
jgi:hypothetical protein